MEAYPTRYSLALASHRAVMGLSEHAENLSVTQELDALLVAAAAERGLCGMASNPVAAASAVINWLVGEGVSFSDAQWMPVASAIDRLKVKPPSAPGTKNDVPLDDATITRGKADLAYAVELASGNTTMRQLIVVAANRLAEPSTPPAEKPREPPAEGTDAAFILKLLKKDIAPDAIVSRASAAGRENIGVKQVGAAKHRYKHLLPPEK